MGQPGGLRENGQTVLVVEDNERSLKLACDVLRLYGYAPLEARTGAEGVALATEHGPALVLLDVQLPDMDGSAALEQLKADGRTAAIPVVAVTALAMKGDRERLLQQGFDGYLAKPIDVRTFAEDVARLMDGP